MSGLIHSEGRTDFAQGNGKSYVSTKPFYQEFLTYTVTENASFQPVGALSVVTGADANKCPAGRVLHLTGRKIYPGVNVGVSKFMVSVYDPITFFTGFIDPSSSTFAKYDQNLPSFFDQGPMVNGSSIPPLGGQAGKLLLNDIAGFVSILTGGTVNAGDASVGQVYISDNSAGTTTIQTTACRGGSRIIVTPVESMATQRITVAGGGGGTVDVPMSYYVSNGFDLNTTPPVPVPAHFTITRSASSGGSKFNWLVIN
jgi:hypothetical protein